MLIEFVSSAVRGVAAGAAVSAAAVWRFGWVPAARAFGDWVRRMQGPDEALVGYRLGSEKRFEGFDVDRWADGVERKRSAEAETLARWRADVFKKGAKR